MTSVTTLQKWASFLNLANICAKFGSDQAESVECIESIRIHRELKFNVTFDPITMWLYYIRASLTIFTNLCIAKKFESGHA